MPLFAIFFLGGLTGATAATVAPNPTRRTLDLMRVTGATDALLTAAAIGLPLIAHARPIIAQLGAQRSSSLS